jgi:ankyrin repeat protein
MIRGWLKAGLTLAVLATPLPAAAQGSINGSEGEAFLKAIEESDNGKALPLLNEPGSRVASYRGYKGDTALHIVTKRRELDWVDFLLRKGADPNIGDSKGDTPLIIAARIGFEEAGSYLLRWRAKPDATNRRGETALIVAVQQRQPSMVSLLLRAGADPDKADHAAGYSARDYAKRDTRYPQLLKLIETVKSTNKAVAGPSIN